MANDVLGGASRLYPSSSAPGPAKTPRRRVPKIVPAGSAALALLAGAALAWRTHPAPAPAPAAPAAAEIAKEGGDVADVVNAEPSGLPFRVEPHVLAKNESIFNALTAMSFSPDEVWGVVKLAKPFANLSRMRAGTVLTVFRPPERAIDARRVLSLQIPLAQNKTLIAREVAMPGEPGGPAFEVTMRTVPYETKLVAYTGTVAGTLWDAAVDAGMDPNLVAELADVFAFDVDFNTEVRQGDRFRLVVEQKYLDGKAAGYGSILAAEYVNRGESHKAIQFRDDAGDAEYFDAQGASLRRMFLRSPLKYRRISSRFSPMRYHPILHLWKAHQGVDFAADAGTPVRTVGDGLIEMARDNGPCGNMVKIRHNATYETAYCHLSAFGPGIRAGERVHQGQVIGYVGMTGLATGPHLHFALYEHGVYVDPLSKHFPAADPMPAKDKPAFDAAKAKLLPLLPDWPDAKLAESPMGPHPAALLAVPRE